MTARVLVPGLTLFLVVLSGHTAPGQDFRRPQGRPAPDAAPVMQINVFNLQHTDAVEMLQTLKDLFGGDDAKRVHLTLHRSTNCVIAVAPEADLERVNVIIVKLEATAAEKKKAAGKEQRTDETKQAQTKLTQLATEVEQMLERVAWAERMVKLNYMSAAQGEAERLRLEDATLKLRAAEAELAKLQAAQDKPKAAAGTAWEYKVVEMGKGDDSLEAQLNKAGADGWELVEVIQRSFQGNSSIRSLVFKRPKR